ncbi:hypothetical protein IACHDJAJ_00137 [Aeromonas phage vB_AdhS_TS3]|nr:hypothetical protein IACHDJAJ_00137 [Aeromonas phage vB_AdhS_TS3]
MPDYCPMCGSEELDHFMNGDTYCQECGYTHNEDDEG